MVEMRYTRSQMEDLKKQNDVLSAKISLKASEKEVEELKKQNEAAEIRLQASEKEVEELKKQNEALASEIRLNASEKEVEELKRQNEGQAQELRALQMSSNTTESQVRELRRQNGCVFTAPVRGVYTFRFSITGAGGTLTIPVGVLLFKNGHHVVIAHVEQPNHKVSTTNGASLLLEVGDVVYVQLFPKTQIYDNGCYYNTFTACRFWSLRQDLRMHPLHQSQYRVLLCMLSVDSWTPAGEKGPSNIWWIERALGLRSAVGYLQLMCWIRPAPRPRGRSSWSSLSPSAGSQPLHYGAEHSIKNKGERTEATISDQQPCQPDIHTVLRELSVKLAEVSVELKYTKSQMSAVEKQLEELKTQNEASEIRLKASEKKVEELKRENEDLALELRTLQLSLNNTESQLTELRTENKYKIAFSASLSTEEAVTTTGPFDTDFTLKYTNVFVNIGKAYNPNTGIFTAPVKGVYTFRFSISGNGSTSVAVGARLFKNGRHVVIGYCQQPSHRVGTTNGASLLLEVGDVVYVQLYPNTQIFDNVSLSKDYQT
ncbi:hypothetical protein NFI96_008648 [Prochilodus magdalenae]|nr:hypothetical protein NFI96_008648 [Prochilodus magdalenae]